MSCPSACALTSTPSWTSGGSFCYSKLCGARGFSNEKSFTYWALTMSCCAAAPLPGAAAVLSVSAMTLSPSLGALASTDRHSRTTPPPGADPRHVLRHLAVGRQALTRVWRRQGSRPRPPGDRWCLMVPPWLALCLAWAYLRRDQPSRPVEQRWATATHISKSSYSRSSRACSCCACAASLAAARAPSARGLLPTRQQTRWRC